MKNSYKFYTSWVVLLGLSISAYFIFSDNPIADTGAAVTFLTVLLTGFFSLTKDYMNRISDAENQRKHFSFSVGAASHMANTAFDKHNEFCEKYMKRVQDVAQHLFAQADTPAVLDFAWSLAKIREDYSIWLTKKIDSDLLDFERALRKLGANARFIQSTIGVKEYHEKRQIMIEENFEQLSKILGLSSPQQAEESVIHDMKVRIREILDIENLSLLRKSIIDGAVMAISDIKK